MSVQLQIDRLIAYQAAEWYELLRTSIKLEENKRVEFIDWISESPRHMDAFLAVAGSAPYIRRALACQHLDTQLLQRADTGVVALPGTTPDRPARPMARLTHPIRRQWRAAAAIVGIVAIVTVIWSTRQKVEYFETAVGEQRTLQLSDGSIVNLNALSGIEVRLNGSRRDVTLERGEATFKVSPDPERPFSVHVQDTVVKALGTQFNVYARHDGVTTVAVLEGKVQVSSGGASTTPRQTARRQLIAGQVAAVQPDGRIEQQADMDAAEAIAWQQRILIFKRTALEDIVKEFNRYNKSVRFDLENIEPGSLRFTGVFSADDPQSLAALLMREPDLRITRRQNAIVIAGMGVRRL